MKDGGAQGPSEAASGAAHVWGRLWADNEVAGVQGHHRDTAKITAELSRRLCHVLTLSHLASACHSLLICRTGDAVRTSWHTGKCPAWTASVRGGQWGVVATVHLAQPRDACATLSCALTEGHSGRAWVGLPRRHEKVPSQREPWRPLGVGVSPSLRGPPAPCHTRHCPSPLSQTICTLQATSSRP